MNKPPDRPKLPPPLTGFTPLPEGTPGDEYAAETASTQPAMRAVRVPIGSEPVPPWATYLIGRVEDMGGKLDQLFEDKKSTNVRLTELEGRFTKLEDAFIEKSKRHSDGIRKGSDTDMKHDGEFAKVFERLDGLDKAVADGNAVAAEMKKVLVDDVKGFFKENPEVVRSLVTFVVTFMGFVSAYFAAKGH
jgi:hypothetical protein